MFTKRSIQVSNVQPSLSLNPTLPGFCPISAAVETLATKSGIEERGAIFTRFEVVDFILDLVGYTADAPLLTFRILEPSFGDGDFLLRIVDRLLDAAATQPGGLTVAALGPAIRGVELHRDTFERTRALVREALLMRHVPRIVAEEVLDCWLRQGDFLLLPITSGFTHIVGNPPYVRQESVPDVLMREYRLRYSTIYDRADIYVPFIERSLDLLGPEGRLSFICADRWMKNRYGQRLREKVRHGFGLEIYVDMVDTDAFQNAVSAYPAITVISRAKRATTRVASRPKIDASALKSLALALHSAKPASECGVSEVTDVTALEGPWVFDGLEELELARRIQAAFPTLEQVGCKVGIGVATGADQAFIGDYASLDVEESRKLPLAMTKDLADGGINWRGFGVINPFADDGKLVNLAQFPRLRAHLDAHRSVIEKRHVAMKSPANWYRTIDRIYPGLARREKLLIPDIRGHAAFVYEPGDLYPHHNLYYIVSEDWDLRALQTVMQAGIARLFVSLYSTKMRGGYLRFQAQYLRRIHLPLWSSVPDDLRRRLAEVNVGLDQRASVELVAELYGLGPQDIDILTRVTHGHA